MAIFRSGKKVLVVSFRKYITSHSRPTLRRGPQTPIEWKSESVCDLWTGVGAGDAYTSKIKFELHKMRKMRKAALMFACLSQLAKLCEAPPS